MTEKIQGRSRLKQHCPLFLILGVAFCSHAVVAQEGVFRVRRLVLSKEKADAYLKEHGMFMPEHAEMLSEPIGEIVLEAPTLEELIKKLQAGPWPY